jgi:NAD(P)-dependent dehydrogenase (short-subunit alcohol dehydrogenase family)
MIPPLRSAPVGMTISFPGQVAVVTGAASGIGRSVAERFAEAGASVAMMDRNEDQGRAVSSQIQAAGGNCEFFSADVKDEADVARTIEKIAARFQRIDHVVNNAGIVLVKGVEDCSAAEWDNVFAVNVRSIFLMVKYALPFLRRAEAGSIVNVSSVSGIVAQTGTPAYVASKGAVLMLSKALALDLAPSGIRVNCVCPGITDTPLFHSHVQSTSDPARTLLQRTRRVPLQRMLSPNEIADAILYLASDRASGITGTELVVDAGYLATAEGPQD